MPSIDTSAAAFLAGLVTSVHCVAMCGPLSCSWAVTAKSGASSFMRDTACIMLAGSFHTHLSVPSLE